mmetsp:Transcript_51634/g.92747  ORF Transcript_51634/g.92747 Transcript_51634/m.92747 type:complete len:807 (-) Transcript_51634:50-2470(-)|eukprot:CAMPEP_0197663730 /NCGR_PEP_ID=MMETSP1338-20131121/58204_1 /TAXON_ID=43686 ORGANISM="Pelagodinium beii, Strain RCC1491" /NCGR_SAMPLE_ID=MMETSP1338 /ASSEMBLY_ACC=CAM_ASM_000754 /LENGTH=806 /DNA_ID=CAMNT_0043242217 /DNA_START=86 /DNA_END=2506 /DNA_ORIENTATION=+
MKVEAKKGTGRKLLTTQSTWVRSFQADSPEGDGSDATRYKKGIAFEKKGRNTLNKYFKDKGYSAAHAWFKIFDVEQVGMIEKERFHDSMEKLAFPGNPGDLWQELDHENTGVISLKEIHKEDGIAFQTFRIWCGVRFESTTDMLSKLLGIKTDLDPSVERERFKRSSIFGVRSMPASGRPGTSPAAPTAQAKSGPALLVGRKEWIEGLEKCGWTEDNAEFLFEALDSHRDDCIGMRNLLWLEPECKRYRLKTESKKRCMQDQKAKAAARQNRQAQLHDFKGFLKKSFGPTYHAWRRALDLDGSMNLQRAELFKVCRQLGWKGDVRMLWQALDNDSCGVASLEELDPSCARQLARLKSWAETTFGHRPSQPLWKAIDKHNKCRLNHETFCRACMHYGLVLEDRQSHGEPHLASEGSQLPTPRTAATEASKPPVPKKIKDLAHWLDWQGKKAITLEDVAFLDGWKPPAYLVAEPNEEAANEMRQLMIDKYGHFLRAWRTVMDKDNSNTCNWNEFVSAMKHLKFHGDVAGAWLALDNDLSGAISLAEVDPHSNDMLIEFKRWADSEFGGVRAAFKVLDRDKSGELTLQEFRMAVQLFGFTGEEILLFKCLDANSQGKLSLNEVTFLDEWELSADDNADDVNLDSNMSGGKSSGKDSFDAPASDSLYVYATEGPGPGAYDVMSGFGALPRMPTARHGGSWTFSRRPDAVWVRNLKAVGPACTDFDMEEPSKHGGWSFGGSQRPLNGATLESPGPGSYEADSAFSGQGGAPKFSFGSRRGVTIHPLSKATRKVKGSHTVRGSFGPGNKTFF